MTWKHKATEVLILNKDSFTRHMTLSVPKIEICWHCELQFILCPLIAGLHPLCFVKRNQTVIQCPCCAACGRGGLASGAQVRVRQGVNVSEEQLDETTGRQPVWTDGPRSVTCPVCGLLPPAIFFFFSLSFPLAFHWTQSFSSQILHTHQLGYNFKSCTNHTGTTEGKPLLACFWNQK